MTSLLLPLLFGASLGAPVLDDGLARYAVVIGHNIGRPTEVPLLYAADDAQRMADVLRDHGGVRADRLVLMSRATDDADAVRAALLAVNDRIRNASEPSALFVYYSGHADAAALHLGETDLPLRELEQLVRGSAARFRLLMVDACRSGALTRVKGDDGAEDVDGYVALTASSASELAMESDELGGSFFTHALVSGLRGVADDDGDGVVTLAEAYRHAFDTTVQATAGTLAGTQHPTFHYDLRGRGNLALTRLGGGDVGVLVVPDDVTVLVTSGERVVAEVKQEARRRALSLAPGRYQLRVRGTRSLYEGDLIVRPGQSQALSLADLKESSYARLTRKGGAVSPGIMLAGVVRTPLLFSGVPLGGRVAVPIVLPWLTVEPRLQLLGSDHNEVVSALQLEGAGEVAFLYVADWGAVSPLVGVFGGIGVVHQRYDAPDRVMIDKFSGGFVFGIESGMQVPLPAGFALDGRLELRANAVQLAAQAPLTLGLVFGVTKGF